MNEQNLIPGKLSVEEASRMGKRGGQASVKARKEKKLLSQVYGEFLADKHAIKTETGTKRITGAELVAMVARTILERGGAPAVAMIKEIREATEGTKSQVEQELKITLDFDTEGL